MKRHNILSVEHLVYLSLFLLGLGIRLALLGQLPLSELEADWALRSYDLSSGGVPNLGAQPGYVLITAAFFYLFGDTNFLARLVPALAGSFLILTPFLIRNDFGRKRSIILAVGLALDPGLVSLSRQSGSPILGLSAALFALVFIYRGWQAFKSMPPPTDFQENDLEGENFTEKPSKWFIPAGALIALVLLSGPGVWIGALAVGFSLWIYYLLDRARISSPRRSILSLFESPTRSGIRAGLLSAGMTLLLAGTLFLRVPSGLGAFVEGFTDFILGWATPPELPLRVAPVRLPLALLVSQPLLLVFGIIGAGYSWVKRDRWGRWQSIWLITALTLVLIYPSRQVKDLVWVLIPLWSLASLQLERFLGWHGQQEWRSLVLAALIVVMAGSIYLNLAGLTYTAPGESIFTLRLLVILGAFLLIGLSTVLIGMGYSWKLAWNGLHWGFFSIILVGLVSGAWANFSRPPVERTDLWRARSNSGQVEPLLETLGDLGEWAKGRRDSLGIIVSADSTMLRWAIRNLDDLKFEDISPVGELPEVIISSESDTDLRMASEYRGQGFIWEVFPEWDSMTGDEWIRWFVFQEAPVASDRIILWARADIFPNDPVLADSDPEVFIGIDPEEEIDLLPQNLPED